MTILAAIDVGSNAIRLAIGETRERGRIKVIETVREPVRLGQDVFSHGRLSPEIMDRALETFHKFSCTIQNNAVEHTAAIATSAMREAENGRELTERLQAETGIQVSVISSMEEARLVHLAVSGKLDIEKGEALLVDIGGGSVEVALTSGGLLIDSKSYKIGTVRMLQILSDERLGPEHFTTMVEHVAGSTRDWLSSHLGHSLIGLFIGTGGNVETVGDLTGRRAGKKATSYASIGDIYRTRAALDQLGFEARRRELRLRPDRADVIYPAIIVLQALMGVVWATTLTIPRVGLREGVLEDMSRHLAAGPQRNPASSPIPKSPT